MPRAPQVQLGARPADGVSELARRFEVVDVFVRVGTGERDGPGAAGSVRSPPGRRAVGAPGWPGFDPCPAVAGAGPLGTRPRPGHAGDPGGREDPGPGLRPLRPGSGGRRGAGPEERERPALPE